MFDDPYRAPCTGGGACGAEEEGVDETGHGYLEDTEYGDDEEKGLGYDPDVPEGEPVPGHANLEWNIGMRYLSF